jgi:hypothetical protein
MGRQRTIIRWIHIVCSFPILGYVYGVPMEVYKYRFGPRYVFIPMMILTALWMWKGHLVRRLFARAATEAPQTS